MHQDSLAKAAITLEPALETITSRAAFLTHLKNTSDTSNGADVPIRAAFEMLECAGGTPVATTRHSRNAWMKLGSSDV